MIYNLATQRNEAIQAFKKMLDDKCTIDLTKKRKKRTYKQNKYLHLLLSYFAFEVGCTLHYSKNDIFKLMCNNEMFVVNKKTKLGFIREVRSTTELNTAELSIAINRFKDFSAKEAGIILPDADDIEFLDQCSNLVEKSSTQEYL